MKRLFSTPPIFSAPVASIDRDNGIIRGVTIAQVGPAKGHDGFIDKTFLLQLVDTATSKPAGIKARFGHPNMCTTALGTYLGRFKNYSYASNKVNADLYLDNTSRSTPNGDLFTYVLDMAEKNPDMFGASIVFEIAESVFLKEEMDGKKVEKEYFRLKDLRATDIVDEPAATDGLFSVDSFPAIATQFLDENPQILELMFNKPDSIFEFLSNYITNSNMNLSDKIKQNFASFTGIFSDQSPLDAFIENSALSSLFKTLCSAFPDTYTADENLTYLQKAEVMHEFFNSHAASLTELTDALNTLQVDHKALVSSSASTAAELETARDTILMLNEQLKARPTIPLNVTDPLLNISEPAAKDNTGKQILKNTPKDLRFKFKK